MIHLSPINVPNHVPWEPLGQVEPGAMPSPSELYPGPWTTHGRGNGHEDVLDANGRCFAHVYCWDKADYAKLTAAITVSEKGHEEAIVAALRAEYLTAPHHERSALRRQLTARGAEAPTPEELAAVGAHPERTPEELAVVKASVEAAIARGVNLRAYVENEDE